MWLKQTDYNDSFRLFLYDVVVTRATSLFRSQGERVYTGCCKRSHFIKFPLLDLKHITQLIYHDSRERFGML